jgi:hypothetical protein
MSELVARRLAHHWHTDISLADLANVLCLTELEVRSLANAHRLSYAPRMAVRAADSVTLAAMREAYLGNVSNVEMQSRFHLSANQLHQLAKVLQVARRGYIPSDAQRRQFEALLVEGWQQGEIAKRMRLPPEGVRLLLEEHRPRETSACPVVKPVEPHGQFASNEAKLEAARLWGRVQQTEIAARLQITVEQLRHAIKSVPFAYRLFPRSSYRRGQPLSAWKEDVPKAIVTHSEVATLPQPWHEALWLVPSVADCFGYPLCLVKQAAALLGDAPLYGGVRLWALLAMTQWLEEGTCPLHSLFQSLHVVATSGAVCSATTSGITTNPLVKTPILAYKVSEVSSRNTSRVWHIVTVDFCLLRTYRNLLPSATRTPMGLVPAAISVVLAKLR